MHLLVLVLACTMGLAVEAARCPSSCEYRPSPNSPQLTEAACSGGPLDLGLCLPASTAGLAISGAVGLAELLDSLRNHTADLPFITELAVSGSGLGDDAFAAADFADLEHLKVLVLAGNGLEHFQLGHMNESGTLRGLRVLDVSRNQIRELPSGPFRTMGALEVLNLGGNRISDISSEAFRGLAALNHLDLSGNALAAIEEDVFAPLASLHYLNLSSNRLSVLGEGCFSSLQRLQQLDVSWNRLTQVSLGTLQALPSLSRLLLADNPALGGSKEAALLVGTGRRLQTVDASRTGLKQIPAALTHSVRTLRLAGNSISAVRCGDLDSYPLLQLLDFTANSLEQVEEDSLGRLEMLRILYLTDNKLRAVPRSLPDGLKILHLERNAIAEIRQDDLDGLPHLEVLLLNDNAIGAVKETAFGPLASLVTLDLSRNPIKTLPAGTLSGPLKLQILRLSSLNLSPPAEDMTFPVLAPERLVVLDLSDSPGLARQLLADTAALAAFRDLQELSLSDTGIEYLRSDLLYFLPQLRALHMTGNRLNCTDLLWLAQWMRIQDQKEHREVICTSPPELFGTPVIDLQDNDIVEPLLTSTAASLSDRSTKKMINNVTNGDARGGIAKEDAAPGIPGGINGNGTTTTVEERVVSPNKTDGVSTSRTHATTSETVPATAAGPTDEEGNLSPITARVAAVATTMPPTTAGAERPTATTPARINHDGRPKSDAITQKSSAAPTKIPAEKGEETGHPGRDANEAGSNNRPALPTAVGVVPNLFMASKENSSNDPGKKSAPGATLHTETNIVSSKYSSPSGLRQDKGISHPGMLVLLLAALTTGSALVIVASHFTRKRRSAYSRQQDIEVNSIASMHGLW